MAMSRSALVTLGTFGAYCFLASVQHVEEHGDWVTWRDNTEYVGRLVGRACSPSYLKQNSRVIEWLVRTGLLEC